MRDISGRNSANSKSLLEIAQAENLKLEVVELDVTQDASVHSAITAIQDRIGTLDVVINNAGVACAGLIETFRPEQAQMMFDVNVFGALRVVRAVLPAMRARGSGLIIYVSSTYAKEIMPFLGIYISSKFALDALAESLSYEIAPLGIETVILQPGTFPTTAILSNLVQAAEPERAAGYGTVAEMPNGVFTGLAEMIKTGQAPDPQQVATAIVDIVAQPSQKRPLRVVVDPSGFTGASRINAVSLQVQQQKLAQLGLLSLGGSWIQ